MNVLRRSSVLGIMALGMTFVIIAGGIDLSVGSMQAFAAIVGAYFILTLNGYAMDAYQIETLSVTSQWIGTIIGIITGGLCGALIGVVIVIARVQPFIVTLGAMSLYRGLALVFNNAIPINVPTYKYLGEGIFLGIPISVVIFIVVSLLCVFLLKYTFLGRYTYALGSNEEAAYYSGINISKIKITIYMLSGLLVGLASMIATSRTVSAQPTAGIGAELDVIAAVVLGGASLSGGRGTVFGTLIGTLLIQFLRNGCTLLGISTNAQLIIIGIIIVAAISFDRVTAKH